jgi:hypothetical protein
MARRNKHNAGLDPFHLHQKLYPREVPSAAREVEAILPGLRRPNSLHSRAGHPRILQDSDQQRWRSSTTAVPPMHIRHTEVIEIPAKGFESPGHPAGGGTLASAAPER